MTVVLGTLPFIATLWLLVVVSAAVLEESGEKILAALKGRAEFQAGQVRVASCVAAPIKNEDVRRGTVPLRAAA